MSIIERIYDILKKENKKPAELAKLLGVSTGQMSTWKKRNTDPPAKFVAQICEFLCVSPYFLLTGIESEPSKNERPVTLYDASGKIIEGQPDAERLLMLRADQALTQRILEVVREEYQKGGG